MGEIERIIHVIGYRREYGLHELDVLIMLALAKLGQANVTGICGVTGGSYDAVRLRVKNQLLGSGRVCEGADVAGGNGKMVRSYKLTNKGERLVVEMLAADRKSSGRSKQARKVVGDE